MKEIAGKISIKVGNFTMEKNFTLQNKAFSASMSDRDFSRLSGFIQEQYGIKLPLAKKVMLEGRIRKRLRYLGMESFSQYCDYLFSSEGREEEIAQMGDVVTTNKTDFFREPSHFTYLTQTVLPELTAGQGSGIGRRLMFWSAGCSTGEEPYTLAIVLSEFRKESPGLDFLILGTDISTKVLDKAKSGIYGEETVEPVPSSCKAKYFMRSRDRSKRSVRVVPELRALVKFWRLNLMEQAFGLHEPVDVIFCRNVIIYFDRETQKELLLRFHRHLRPGGYLFMGHSETLNGLDIPLALVAPTVYRKPKS